MGFSAEDTARKHEQILTEASRLFREKGFAAVSVNEVMKAAGLTHGPFYNHFSSKEELMAASLARGIDSSITKIESYPTSEQGKHAYVDGYLSNRHRESFGTGCSIAALASEARFGTQAREQFTAGFKRTIDKLAAHFPWRSKRSARGEALFTAAAMAGAIILARAVDDETLSNEILEETKKRLK